MINTLNSNIEKLFDIADKAKDALDYDTANEIFAVLAIAALSESSGLHFEYEQANDDLIESLSDPCGAGYYDLVAVANKGGYLCIPLPLIQKSFMNDFVKKGATYQERTNHCREYSDLEGEKLDTQLESIRGELKVIFSGIEELVDRCVVQVLRLEKVLEDSVNAQEQEQEQEQYSSLDLASYIERCLG